ncbi:26189_t:CDS:1, partial [Racocetra persica]
KFNRLAQSNCTRIPCGLHVLNLIFNNFEDMAFGKLSVNAGFSKTRHPFNLLYLAWMLHDGYAQSDKDSPLNMRSETIRSLYKTRLNYQLTKYQHPLKSRWQYELIAAEQYLERRELHIEFVAWFLPKLKTLKKVPSSYVQKWELFQNWLNDSELNIKIQCLVKFGHEFYRPFSEFL